MKMQADLSQQADLRRLVQLAGGPVVKRLCTRLCNRFRNGRQMALARRAAQLLHRPSANQTFCEGAAAYKFSKKTDALCLPREACEAVAARAVQPAG